MTFQRTGWEVEIKFRAGHSFLREILAAQGACRLGRNQQRDTYYQHPFRDFGQSDEALRLRRSKGLVQLTYKGPKEGLAGKVRQEIELSLPDPAAFEELLQALGFKPAGLVEKTREEWKWEEAIIALDQVMGLGEFIEVEVPSVGGDRSKALVRAVELAGLLGLNPKEEVRSSYLELLRERI